jgi:hypothetical protein
MGVSGESTFSSNSQYTLRKRPELLTNDLYLQRRGPIARPSCAVRKGHRLLGNVLLGAVRILTLSNI